MPLEKRIEQTLKQAFSPLSLKLVDTSSQHGGVESHFSLYIVASSFSNCPLIKRHRLIHKALSELLPKFHALHIVAYAPEEDASLFPSPPPCSKKG